MFPKKHQQKLICQRTPSSFFTTIPPLTLKINFHIDESSLKSVNDENIDFL